MLHLQVKVIFAWENSLGLLCECHLGVFSEDLLRELLQFLSLGECGFSLQDNELRFILPIEPPASNQEALASWLQEQQLLMMGLKPSLAED